MSSANLSSPSLASRNLSSASLPSHKPLLAVLDGVRVDPPPVWLMRQAGRFLPEYRALRAQAPSFLDFAYDPAMASEATLQPVRRFGFDAAILFSDILVVPDALNCPVSFVEGEGPRLTPIEEPGGLARLSKEIDLHRLAPVFETISLVKRKLPEGCAMLGFCGAPWTVASYMIAGRGTRDLAPARLFAYRYPEAFKQLIELLVQASIAYLVRQFEAGVEAVQVFESFAGAIPKAFLGEWSLTPVGCIIAGVRAKIPDARVIVFAKGGGAGAGAVAAATGANAVGIDWSVDPSSLLGADTQVPAQGNLDPLALVAGGEAMERGVKRVLAGFGDRPHIFNLGHGVVPETPLGHVEEMLAMLRKSARIYREGNAG
jgi:uroporphyrinogen decarboxylase